MMFTNTFSPIFKRHTIGKILLPTLLGALLVSHSFNAQAENVITLTPAQIDSLGIKAVPLIKKSEYFSESYPAEATIPLSQTFLVTAPVSGLLTQIHHVHGPIEKGQVIAELLSPELLNAQKNYLNTLSDLSTAKRNLTRALTLSENGVVSSKNKQQAQSDVNKLTQIKGQQRQDLSLIGMSETSIAKLESTQKQQPAIIEIKAATSGELFNLQVKVGQRLMTNQAIISIGQTNPIVVDMRLPVAHANAVNEGLAVKLKGYKTLGYVAHVSAFVDPMTQTFEVHNKFNNDAGTIHPGQLFQIQFVHKVLPTENVYQVPASAIGNFDGKDVIYLKQQLQMIVQPIEILTQQNGALVFKTDTPISDTAEVIVESTSAVKTALLAMPEEK